MKVAFDNHTFFHQKYGGISNYYTNLILQLNKLGISARAFAAAYVNRYIKDHPQFIQGQFIPDFLPFTKKMIRYSSRLVNTARLNAWKPDLLHYTYYKNDLLYASSVPKIITIYDFIAEKILLEEIAKNKKKAVKIADCIICISENTRKDLEIYFPEEAHKAQVVYLGHEMQGLQAIGLPTHLTKPYILYVGNRNGYKNFSGFIRAFASSDFIRKNFSIVAFGGSGFSNEERNLVRETGLNQQQIHHLEGDNSMLVSLYQSAALFAYPSLYEGFGIPPLEAFAQGCPVAASKLSSIPEVCGDGCQYFDPYQPESIAEAMEKVLQDTALKQELIHKGRLQSQKFTWRRCALDTAKIYKTLI